MKTVLKDRGYTTKEVSEAMEQLCKGGYSVDDLNIALFIEAGGSEKEILNEKRR